MCPASGAVAEILRRNAGRLDTDWFDRGRPRDAACREVYWSLVATSVLEALGLDSRTSMIEVGRMRRQLMVAEGDLVEFDRELGGPFRESPTFRDLVRAELLGDDPLPLESPLARTLPDLPLALLLVLAHLRVVDGQGPQRDFGYAYVELQNAANSELAWIDIGVFDEVRLATELFTHASGDLIARDDLFRVPYHACWRTLVQRAPAIRHAERRRPRGRLHLPFNLTLERPVEAEGAIEAPATETLSLMRNELEHARKQQAALAESSALTLLPALLEPLLRCPTSPVAALDVERCAASGLASELLTALAALIESGAISFLGELGEPLGADVPLSSVDLRGFVVPDSRGTDLVVIRRGLRWRQHIVTPMWVAPRGDV